MRRFMPDPARLRGTWVERVLGKVIHDPHLLHLNRRSVSLGVLIGLFWAFTPIPSQMVPAALCAWLFRANLPISMSLVWISNPLTIPPLFVAFYMTGSWMLGMPMLPPDGGINMEWVHHRMGDFWKPVLLGSLTFSVVSAGLGYALVRTWWISTVRANWAARRKARAARRKASTDD
ncbi:DUF2062 domain-containing protein [Litorivicinus lipolyticus]|nr:DUF2062 domain-containing protein [Litorivicinus lipolyticus]